MDSQRDIKDMGGTMRLGLYDAAFAEKMRVMEAEVYGADEAKNAKKKQDNKK